MAAQPRSYGGVPMHEMGDDDSHGDGSSNDQLEVSTISKRNKSSTGTAQVGTRTNNNQDHRIDMDTSDNETHSDENEKKMKGRRSYVFTMAASSLAWTLALIPYWAHSSQFKDGNLPDSDGFKVLQTVQVLVLLCLWAGTFIPQRVCRRMSNWVVWTCAAGALFIIVISWALVFEETLIINCIKAPCLMVIKCTKVMYDDKVQQWLADLSLPECIKATFKKMQDEKSYPRVPKEPA